MAKGDDVIALLKAGLKGDRSEVVSIGQSIAANESTNSSLKERVGKVLNNTPLPRESSRNLPQDLQGLVRCEGAQLTLDQMALPDTVTNNLDRFLEDQSYADAIHEAGFCVPNRVLLSGPPGNGKTTLAGAMAEALDRPLFVADFSSIVSSRFGETGANIADVFRGLAERPCVLFIDEMETLLSERAGQEGTTEVGEAKRIVSTLLMEIDRLSESIILVGATNHAEMLDRAVVRRFDYHWNLPNPDREVVDAWLKHFAERHPDVPILDQMPTVKADGRWSLSDIEVAATQWCRRWIVENQKRDSRRSKS